MLAYLSDSPEYRPYFEENDGFLTKLNLMEIHYQTLKSHGPDAALDVLETFSKYAIEFGISDIAGAMKTRLRLKKAGLDVSYADALGYYLALKLNAKFLTGDKMFKQLEGVEFVA